MSSGSSFNRQIPFFERDFQVFAPDLKGFGKNVEMPYPYSLNDYILEVKEYMYKFGLTKPHVVAHSFGGRIAIKASAIDKELFSKLVLCGAAGLKPNRRLKKRVKGVAFNLLKRVFPREKLKGFYSSEYLSLSDTMKKSFSLIISEHLDERLKDIENPTLIVFGRQDKETPLYMARRLNLGIQNSRLIILDGAGHFCFVDKPLKFNTEVKEFLLS